MAEVNVNEGGGKKKGGKQRAKKHTTHIDMTPMVDLACLLLTFFMLTTAFSKPKTMEIVLPEKNIDKKDGPVIQADKTLNILISGEDAVYWFVGVADPNKPEETVLAKSDYSKDGIRKLLLEKNKALFEQIDELTRKVTKGEIKMDKDTLAQRIKNFRRDDKTGPIVLIKADDLAKYRNMVDIIDEMAICNVARYAIVDITPYEKELLLKAPK